jgi:uncharacterized protein (TIGR00297 family)
MLGAPAPWWAAVLLAAGVAGAAWRRGALSPGGVVAALVTGTLAARAAWGLGLYLIAWFVAAALLSRLGRDAKARRTRGTVAKGDRRDARQVLANGGVFAVAATAIAAGAPGLPASGYAVLAAGALAAAGADTWGTEIGTWLGGTPRALRTGRPVPPGTSGAVTPAGIAATVGGALAIALAAVLLRVVPTAAWGAVAAGGVTGAFADSIAGATLQERRRCPVCGTDTEQRRHDCGAATRRVAGLPGCDNDAVNLLATVAGGAVALLLWRAG